MSLQYLKKVSSKFPTSWFQHLLIISLEGDTIIIDEHDQAFSEDSK